MALLYWWPVTGWRWRCRGLRKVYREDPAAAVEAYRLDKAKKTISSNMGL